VQPGNADAETVLHVVAGCPTGALHATRRDGVTADAGVPVAPVEVQITANGPLYVRGDVVLTDEDDTRLAGDSRLALCRCGLSARKPFCDNSHRAAGWRDG
jgi:Iron-binding zinc finger CDGSH type